MDRRSVFARVLFLVRRGPHARASKRLKALQHEKFDLVARMEALLNSADDDHRDLTADENDYQDLEAWLPALDKRSAREQVFFRSSAE